MSVDLARRLILLALLLIVPLGCQKNTSVSKVNETPEGIAIKGYDPVAYFTDHKPVKGKKEFAAAWEGATWMFASAEHRDAFREDPEKYAPRYGGYCAYAVSQGKTADIDPEAWTIFEGKLYLNLNADVQSLWERDKQGYIQKANENWPRIVGHPGTSQQ